MYQKYYRQQLRDPEEIGQTRRQAIAGPMAPRESITLAEDSIARKREFVRQRYIPDESDSLQKSNVIVV
jgi:hypothetical protein